MGPRVVATAFASVSTPSRSFARPSTPNFSSCQVCQYALYGHQEPSGDWTGMPKRSFRTLCANLCCCRLKLEFLNRDADDRAVDRAFEANARCMLGKRGCANAFRCVGRARGNADAREESQAGELMDRPKALDKFCGDRRTFSKLDAQPIGARQPPPRLDFSKPSRALGLHASNSSTDRGA